jgi:hypothetical protein
MRAVSVLVLLLLGFGLGFVPSPASAAPCPLHAAAHGDHGSETAGAAAAKVEIATAAETDHLLQPTPRSPSDHPVPEGQSCCHIAGTAALPVGPVLEPRAKARAPRARSWLPPRAAPVPDIFRPPASA